MDVAVMVVVVVSVLVLFVVVVRLLFDEGRCMHISDPTIEDVLALGAAIWGLLFEAPALFATVATAPCPCPAAAEALSFGG